MTPRAARIALALWNVVLSLGAVFALLAASAAFAQDPASSPPGVGDSTAQLIFKGVASLLGLAATALVALSARLIATKTKAGILQNVLMVVQQKVVAAVMHVWTEDRALIDKDLADGHLSPDEIKELKNRTLAVLKADLSSELLDLPKLLGLADANGFLGGLVGKAIAALGLAPTPGTPPSPAAASDTKPSGQ